MTFTVMNTRKSLPYWVVPPALRSLNCTKPVFASAKFSTSFSKDTGVTAIARTWAPWAKLFALRRHKTISFLAMASASLSRATRLENASAPSREKVACSGGRGGGEMTDEKCVAVVTRAAQGIGRPMYMIFTKRHRTAREVRNYGIEN